MKQVSSIQTGIELNDQFSGVLNNIISSVNLAVSAMYDMQQSMNADIDTSSIEGARDEINQATAAIEAMNQAASRQTAPDIAPPVVDGGNQEPIPVLVEPVLHEPLVENPEPIRPEIQPNAPPDPEPVEIPVTWNTDGVDVFTGTGVERFQQEVQSANDMLNTLNTTQARISQTAQGMDMDCQHFFRQIFLGYFSDIVQAFDTLRKNVCGDDYTSLHNPIVLSSVLPAYGMFHSIQILFL